LDAPVESASAEFFAFLVLLWINRHGTQNHAVDFALLRVALDDNKGAIYGLAVVDLDGDGFPNIVAAGSDAPGIIVFNRPASK
jgi:hypothetical protein